MYPKVKITIDKVSTLVISAERKAVLSEVASFIKERSEQNQRININCVCTHNSRRSHLCQVWAKVAGMYHRVRKVNTYSGGTEATAVYPQIIETLKNQGFNILKLSEGVNPMYALKFDENAPPLHLYSKKYDSPYNPASKSIAFMNCDHADQNCPVILGADQRFKVNYVDPKRSDGSDNQAQVYLETSELIASEMFYLFAQVKK